MKKYILSCMFLAALSQGAMAVEIPDPSGQWRIAGLDFGVRHMIHKDSLCADNKIETYAMAYIKDGVMNTIYNRVVERIRLICRIPSSQLLEIPVVYHVVDVPVVRFVLISEPNDGPIPRLENIEKSGTTNTVSTLFQSYWDSYGDPEYRVPRNTEETLPAWAIGDYLYALGVDREVHKVGVYDVYFDSRFEGGALNIASKDAFRRAIEVGHPLALIMSMLNIMPYAGMTEYDIEGYWRDSLSKSENTVELNSYVKKLVKAGYLQGDILDSFLKREGQGGLGDDVLASSTNLDNEDQMAEGVLPVLELSDNTATSAIQDYFRNTDCDSFPRVFFDDPDNNSPRKIALAASLYSFAAGGCVSGIRNAETIITLSGSAIDTCSIQGSKSLCNVVAQYQCDGNNFLSGSAQAKLACSAYLKFMLNAKSIWTFDYDSNARKWNAEFISRL